MDEIPAYLREVIQEGKVVLFLGAGASVEAQNAAGKKAPKGKELATMIANKFLGGEYNDQPLAQVAELAISESDLFTVQQFIASVFEPLKPTKTHELIPTFRWRAIVTTNYDRLVEDAYTSRKKDALQHPALFIENGDRIADLLRDPNAVPLIKLHGCISRISSAACPLILSPDQYAQYKSGRDRLFAQFADLGVECPILFIGSTIDDSDLRTILIDIGKITPSRPRYYNVSPGIGEIKRRFWENNHKVTGIQGTFDQFFEELNRTASSVFRGIARPDAGADHPIAAHFAKSKVELSDVCKQFLEVDVEFVRGISHFETVTPKEFYRGVTEDWAPISQKLDVRRGLADTILTDHFIAGESDRPDSVEFIVVKAHAGAGKSVLMRRIAWDAAHDFKCLCLYLKPHGAINTFALEEIIAACNERVFLFIDNLGDRVREITHAIRNVGPAGKKLTIIGTERLNEWNVLCEPLKEHATKQYELRYLSESEVDDLLKLLDTHHALGTLAAATDEERRTAFVDRAGRILLVALHEATLGKKFEEIIEDEFRSIVPEEAQKLYLTVCVLNRLNVPVRAGLIARVYGIRFEDFQERLFAPLEHVVRTKFDPVIRDRVYLTRHPHIAAIVFERMLQTQEGRFSEYIKVLGHLNIDYDTDRRAFRGMMRGRAILDLFQSDEYARKLFDIASENVGEDAHLLHQEAIYELRRQGGDLKRTAELLDEAQRLAPNDRSIMHSRAEYNVKAGAIAGTDLEKERFRREAAKLCNSLIRGGPGESYAFHTLAKLETQRLKEMLVRPGVTDAELEAVVKDVESHLTAGMQRFPNDLHLLASEAELAQTLAQSSRAIDALEKAFRANSKNAFIARRLSECYHTNGRIDDAVSVLRTAVEANPLDRILHFAFACAIIQQGKSQSDEVLYHLQRSFNTGDSNYKARLLYGRELFAAGKIEESKAIFRELKSARVPYEVKDEMSHPLEHRSSGVVRTVESSHCFIMRDATSDWIHARRERIGDELWKKIKPSMRVTFQIAFNFFGPGAYDIREEGT